MPHISNQSLEIIVYAAAAAVLLYIGYRIGRLIGSLASTKVVAQKEQELFTTQRGFKTLYDQEVGTLKSDKENLKAQVEALTARVEEYRRKAAGFGGLFNTGGKRAEAMYALLLENETLEEALYSQNEKLKSERTDALREQLRNTSYRRVLMSQLMNDERIKGYMSEIISDDKILPASNPADTRALPEVKE